MGIVAVTGGRHYWDADVVKIELNRIHTTIITIDGLIHGAAEGLDTLAAELMRERIRANEKLCDENRKYGRWPRMNHLWMAGCIARWDDLLTPPVVLRYRRDGTSYNAAAGGMRNQQMVNMKPHALIHFPGGTGTADMMRRAAKAGIRLIPAGQQI